MSDAPRSGHRSSAINPNSIAATAEAVMADQRKSITQLANEEERVPRGSMQEVLQGHLKVQKVSFVRKQQSIQYKHTNSSLIKFKVRASQEKVLYLIFWDNSKLIISQRYKGDGRMFYVMDCSRLLLQGSQPDKKHDFAP